MNIQENIKSIYLVIGLAIAIFMSSLDTSVVNVVLPTLVKAFHTSFSQVQWVVLSYLLVLSSIIVSVGKLGDIFGKRNICLFGVLVFSLASGMCGLSPNIFVLIISRAVQGIGAAIIMALGFAIAQDTVPKKKIVQAMTLLTATISIGFAVGPTLGGTMIEKFGWASIFFLNVPLGVIAFFLIMISLPADNIKKDVHLDIAGMLTMALSLTAYIAAMTLSEVYGFLSAQVISLIAAAVIIGTLFIITEKRAKMPLVPLHMFRDKILTASIIASIFVYSNMICAQIIAAFFLSGVDGFSEMQIGIALTIGSIMTIICGFLAGYLDKYFSEGNIMVFGILLMCASDLSMVTLTASHSYWDFCWRIAILNSGLAFFQTPNNLLVMDNAKPDQRGTVSALLALGRNLGLTTGAAVMNTIFALFIIAAAGHATSVSTVSPDILTSAYHKTFFIMLLYMLFTAFIVKRSIKNQK